MTSGAWLRRGCAWATLREDCGSSAAAGAAAIRAAVIEIRVRMRQIMPQRTKGSVLRRKTGREAARGHRRVDLALLARLDVLGRQDSHAGLDLRLDQRFLQIAGAVDFDPRPCNQEDGSQHGDHSDDRGNRMLRLGIRSAAEVVVSAGMSHTVWTSGQPPCSKLI